MMRAGAVEREKTSHARGPGFDSRPGIFSPFLGPFSFASFLFFNILFLPSLAIDSKNITY